MLVLTRRVGEKLVIGGDVQVTVLSVRGEQVRVGISAPKNVPVHREEIYELIKRERAAGTAQLTDQTQQPAAVKDITHPMAGFIGRTMTTMGE